MATPVDTGVCQVEVPKAARPSLPSRRPLPYVKDSGKRFTTVVVNTPDQKLGRSFRCYEHRDGQVAAELVAEAYERGKADGGDQAASRIKRLRRKLKKSKQGRLFAGKCGELAGIKDSFAQELNHADSDDVKGMLVSIKRLRDENATYVAALGAMTDVFDALSSDGAEAGAEVALQRVKEHLDAGREKHARELISKTLNAFRRKPEVAHG